MGIKSLWGAIKPYVQDGHLNQFRGKRVAVDMYVWLHVATKGCVVLDEERLLQYFREAHAAGAGAVPALCVEDIVTLRDDYIDNVVRRVDCLRNNGIVPVCIFDGADIPMKAATNVARKARRDESFREALQRLEENYLRAGRGQRLQRYAPSYAEGLELLTRALDISTEVAHPIIRVLREERHIECIVAPYEADAQLTYLAQSGYVQAALSEDSDLIAYYCPCVIAKVDYASGRCAVLLPPQSMPLFFKSMAAAGLSRISRAEFATISAPGTSGSLTSSSSFSSSGSSNNACVFTYESFLLGCVMSGCDYVDNLEKIGVKTAFKLVSHSQSLPQLLSLLKNQYGFPEEKVQAYRRRVLEAFYCFAHHIVYCPRRRQLMNLHPLPPGMEGAGALKTELVGELWPASIAQKVCEECLYDPETHRLYVGTYQPALEGYLRRTRRGQASLTSFQGFQGFTVAKVVLHADADRPLKRERPEAGSQEPNPSGSGCLRKVQEALGFLDDDRRQRVVVRSKYFLRTDGRQGVEEDWSASSPSSYSSSLEDGGGEEAGSGGGASPATATATSATGAEASVPHGLSTPAISELTLGMESPPPPHSSLSVASPADVHESSSSSGNPPPQQTKAKAVAACPCPFGYTQCGRSHSIFVQCFAGKNWSRSTNEKGGDATRKELKGEEEYEEDVKVHSPLAASAGSSACPSTAGRGGSPTAATKQQQQQAPPVASPASPTYQCAGFRPPRSLAHDRDAGHKAEEGNATVKKTSIAIFDQLAFNKN